MDRRADGFVLRELDTPEVECAAELHAEYRALHTVAARETAHRGRDPQRARGIRRRPASSIGRLWR